MNKEYTGIGTLNEHSLHAFLKEHYEPDASKREIKVGRYVADILNTDGIMEIQTRGFSNLKNKLEFFLKENKVTVIYPVAQIKRVIWVDPATGETTRPRRSPKTGAPIEIFRELVYIKNLLGEQNLKFKIVLLEIDEYRFLDGWSHDHKKGSTRKDRVPLSILGEADVSCAVDYQKLLPEGLPHPFTCAELVKIARISPNLSQRALNVLCSVDAVHRVGKKGRAFLYELT